MNPLFCLGQIRCDVGGDGTSQNVAIGQFLVVLFRPVNRLFDLVNDLSYTGQAHAQRCLDNPPTPALSCQHGIGPRMRSTQVLQGLGQILCIRRIIVLYQSHGPIVKSLSQALRQSVVAAQYNLSRGR